MKYEFQTLIDPTDSLLNAQGAVGFQIAHAHLEQIDGDTESTVVILQRECPEPAAIEPDDPTLAAAGHVSALATHLMERIVRKVQMGQALTTPEFLCFSVAKYIVHQGE